MVNKIDNFNTSITDMCGRRVLGMNGSLTGYINTGNPYHSGYYKSNNNFQNNQKKSILAPLLKGTILIATIAGLIALVKKGKIKLPDINNTKLKNFNFGNFTNNIKTKLNKINIKNPFANLKIKNPFANLNLKNKFSNLSKIFKKQSPTP